ncbi:anthranilate synthase component I [Naumannella cuiyingiana]|uniref:Anthranilate synthase component 1 n=1 Tax=Naumannella cuiyingiana TaxID=1347891 RepID=A0A7Z0D654_9ACTN|nr:anthranilate synthase component I [Naumannella cuiyingiana]NYI69630.1 anthranilate synthase component 1 [Naumannella cuiyingiana]
MSAKIEIEPALDEFLVRAKTRRVVSVHTRLRADTENPLTLYRQLAADRPGTFLLESAEAGVWSRWSFVGVRSAATLSAHGGEGAWTGQLPAALDRTGDPLALIEQALAVLHTPRDPDLPPFTSGLVGTLGYDVVRRLEHLPDTGTDDLRLPDVAMLLATDVAAFDHHRGEVWLIANALNWDESPQRAEQAWRDARDRVQAMADQLARPRASEVAVRASGPELPQVRDQRSTADHHAAVAAAVEEIHAGEAFQIVVSQRFDVPTRADAFDIYRELRTANPSPYMYLLRLGDFDVVGSSPEALVTVSDRTATTHPIAGTRWRSHDPDADAALESELLADPKERAEHVMLVDLGRNDLGRVCVPGTVRVIEFMVVRRYSHVMHLESTVTGRLADGVTPLRATLACFPAGTLSGAPKVRAMEIIDKLEPTRRGLYGGTVGYFDFAGDADNAIAIRTAVLKGGIAHVQAGGGVVADSTPAYEEAESRTKAAAVLRAIAAAERLAPLASRDGS